MTHFAYLCFAGLWLLLLGAQGGVLWLMRVQIWAQPSCCLWIMLTGGTETLLLLEACRRCFAGSFTQREAALTLLASRVSEGRFDRTVLVGCAIHGDRRAYDLSLRMQQINDKAYILTQMLQVRLSTETDPATRHTLQQLQATVLGQDTFASRLANPTPFASKIAQIRWQIMGHLALWLCTLLAVRQVPPLPEGGMWVGLLVGAWVVPAFQRRLALRPAHVLLVGQSVGGMAALAAWGGFGVVAGGLLGGAMAWLMLGFVVRWQRLSGYKGGRFPSLAVGGAACFFPLLLLLLLPHLPLDWLLFGLFLGWGLPILRSIIRLPSLPLPTTSSPKKTFPCP